MGTIIEKNLIWNFNGNLVNTCYWSLKYGYVTFYYSDLTFAGDIRITEYSTMLSQGKVKTDYSFKLCI